jgi:histone H3/H4
VTGLRSGAFDRLLRFSNVTLFGITGAVRLQSDFKRSVQEWVERILVQVISEARDRRAENGGKVVLPSNFAGAFVSWARVARPQLIKEYVRVGRVYESYNHFEEQRLQRQPVRDKQRFMDKLFDKYKDVYVVNMKTALKKAEVDDTVDADAFQIQGVEKVAESDKDTFTEMFRLRLKHRIKFESCLRRKKQKVEKMLATTKAGQKAVEGLDLESLQA